MGFPRQECWSGLSFPSPGDLPDPGIEPGSPALALYYQATGEAQILVLFSSKNKTAKHKGWLYVGGSGIESPCRARERVSGPHLQLGSPGLHLLSLLPGGRSLRGREVTALHHQVSHLLLETQAAGAVLWKQQQMVDGLV